MSEPVTSLPEAVAALGALPVPQGPEPQALSESAELAAFRALELCDLDGRVSASCEDPEHPTWLRKQDDKRGCPWCRVGELEAERHVTNEALDDAVQALRVDRAAMVCRECNAPVMWVEGANDSWWNHTQPAEDGHSIVPRPLLRASADVSADRLTRMLAPTQALREVGACMECGDGPSVWCPGCAKCSCVAEHDMGCARRAGEPQ